MIKTSQFFLPLLLIGVASSAVADQFDQANQWLARMGLAMQNINYQGTFVYMRGEDVTTLRVTHVSRDGKTRERLQAVSGPPREIIRDEHGVRALAGPEESGSEPSLFMTPMFPRFPEEALEQARKRYVFLVGGTGRIAGLLALKISIIPKDQLRYGYEFWLERETGLVLRWVLYDEQRKTLAKVMFTELIHGDRVEWPLDDLAARAESFVTIRSPNEIEQQVQEDAGESAIAGIPAGFDLAAVGRNPESIESKHLVFSDGLASVSVYVEPEPGTPGLSPGLSQMGAANAWSGQSPHGRLTVIGEVPVGTVKQIATAFSNASSLD